MGRKAEFQHSADARWESHYNNSAEELYPDAFHPATGKPVRTLTPEEDEKVIKHANKAYAGDY